jgi:hypothetical protein
MLNLIPPIAKRAVTKEYWTRAVTVIMFLLGTGCLIVASFLLPTYVLVANQLAGLEEQVAAKAASTASFDASAGALGTAMFQAGVLLSETAVVTEPTELVTVLTELAGTSVDLSTISYSVSDGVVTLIISGEAVDRQTLASYRDAIEAHEYFATADLPISSLVKDRNLLFTMTITTQKIDVLPTIP